MIVKQKATLAQRYKAAKLLAVRLRDSRGGVNIINEYRRCLGTILLVDRLTESKTSANDNP